MLQDLPTDRLHLRSDARAIDQGIVAGLAESIALIGLIHPIRVRKNSDGWEVIAGAHRLEAHRSLGLVEIACDVVEDSDGSAELAKIDENIYRLDPSPAERARDMARRKALYPHVHGNSSDRLNPRFTLHAAMATGRPEPTIIKEVSRGENILPEVLEMVTGTKLDTPGYLDTLKQLPGSEQMTAAARDLIQERRAERVAMAQDEKEYAALVSAWRKASKTVRQRFLDKVTK